MARSFQNLPHPAAPRPDSLRIEHGINDDVLRFTFLGTVGVSALYALAVVAHLLVLEGNTRVVMMLAAATSAVALGVIALAIRRRVVPPRLSHLAAFAVFLVILVNSGLMLWITEDMKQSTNFILMIAVIGFVMLRRRWLFATLLVTLMSWATIVTSFMTHDDLVHYGFGIGMATLAALLVSLARRRAVTTLVQGRIDSEKQAMDVARLSTRFETVVESALDGIFSLDAVGRTLLVNAAATRITRRNSQELIGKDFHEAVGHVGEDGEPHDGPCPVDVVAAGGRAISVRGELFTHPDGTRYAVEFTAAPLAGPAGESDGAVVVFRDVSEAVASEKLKDHFVSNVSHELRTPLTSIGGALRLLASGAVKDPSETENLLRISLSSTDRLVRLVEQILDIERIESGRLRLDIAPCDASEMVSAAVNSVLGPAIEAGVQVRRNVAPISIEADHDRIVQVLVNLIGNAVKFSDRGGKVTVTVASDADFATFSVVDHGRGIPENRISSLFQRYEQVGTGESRRVGAGLGLAISQGIVQQHRGEIRVTSQVGQGSTFSFKLPLKQPPTESSSR